MRKLIWIALVSQITELRHVGRWPPCQQVRVDSLEVILIREIMVGVLFIPCTSTGDVVNVVYVAGTDDFPVNSDTRPYNTFTGFRIAPQ